MATPARLSTETIINLGENGVKAETFINIMKVSLEQGVDKLTRWDKGLTIFDLCESVARAGGVYYSRRARMEAGAARAKGYIYEDRQEEDEEYKRWWKKRKKQKKAKRVP